MRTAILLSGGMDSMVLLAWMVSKKIRPVLAIAFDYGQRHVKELQCAERIAVLYRVTNFAKLKIEPIKGSSLTGHGTIPHAHYESPEQLSTVVPGRNALMISTACSRMFGMGYDALYLAPHAGDAAIYSDCRKEFVVAISDAMKASCSISIEAPFLNYTKRDIALIGRELGVPVAMSWSCYEGGEEPCGKCGACMERQEAML